MNFENFNSSIEKELNDLEKRLGEKYNFQILDHRLDVSGYCSECRENA